jgi:hypothetical protein
MVYPLGGKTILVLLLGQRDKCFLLNIGANLVPNIPNAPQPVRRLSHAFFLLFAGDCTSLVF